ncbi:MAG: DUF3788 family protein [Ignavibacteriales bacterium]|nr:DUF3788 family protein [Ignavibacteriales bacterium]
MASIFSDKSLQPNDQMLLEVLGKSKKYWDEIKQSLNDKYGELTEEWKFYGQKIGWTLKLLKKKRNLFFFTPYDKYFKISFVFGEKAVAVIEKSDLPENLISELVNARKYVEGRGLAIEVKTQKEVQIIQKLVAIKIDN